ncbi:hypothetical protein DFH07DRAFT_999985 [Mycena maculata]|uniref:BTB domain-containing protein n=1 Tax=Mycena maculata TaxID=230809 RepID=A0AAD7MQG4_9AGAR|nr:hypothetical protein DFH07DRAFT_999985 [Mycena maculata]
MSSTMSPEPSEEEVPGNRHHPKFYFADGTAIFRLSSRDCPAGILYKLHAGLLAQRSTFFSSLFSLAREPHFPGNILSEGKFDENPIELPYSISQPDFDGLLTYLYVGPSMYPDSEDFLVSVMKLSAFFDIADGIEFTTREFVRRGDDLHPALQFELARCFQIDEWIEPAFRRLMELDLLSLDAFQVSQIGHMGYFWLTQTKAKVQNLRKQIAFHVPPLVNSDTCDTPGTCMYSWTREWEERVRQLIHHPEEPISCLNLLDQLRNVHIDGLCNECQDLTVTWIWGKCLLTQEEQIIDEAIQELMDLQTERPLRIALGENAAEASARLVVV